MNCIACGSQGEFRCRIKDVTVCLCSQHLDREDAYDAVTAEH
jgi:hypothetical protein